jgi:predicted RNA-binding Zn-ribbon protein involved in translation (DUF1610 family)
MVSIDQMPVAFKCPACRKVARTTRAHLLREPVVCPLCQAEIAMSQIAADVKRSRENFSVAVREMEGRSLGV